MFASTTQISPAIHMQRRRTLAVAGTVMVRQGQKVKPEDVIAEAALPVHHRMVDVVKTLGLTGPKAAESLIQRKVGETLGEHDIIAETGGLFSRVIRTPGPGKIVSIHNGQVLIETETQKVSLLANYSGTIEEIIADRGIVIRTSGALIQGAWGNGKFAVGPLICKAENQTTILTSADLEITARGSIIAAAICNDGKVLDNALNLPVAGLILGTIPASLRQKVLSLPFPVLVVDGFGQSGMNSAALKLLSLYNNHEVILNTDWGIESDIDRPEALISAPVEEEMTPSGFKVTTGQRVRIHCAPLMGQIGTIEKIIPGLTALPNGLRVYAASVIMDNKERKTIPIFNLDVLGFTQ